MFTEDQLVPGAYFRGSNSNWDTLYGKCYERVSDTHIRARIFTPRAKFGDNGEFPIGDIDEIMTEEVFQEEFEELCDDYWG